MKIIRNAIFSLLLVFILMVIYFNKDEIDKMVYKFIVNKRTIVASEPNQYRRKYEYERFIISDDYEPHSYKDLENIFFNILNNGYDKFTFFCPKEYISCKDDVKKLTSDNMTLSKISGYVSPYNSYQIINTSISSYDEIIVDVVKKYTNDEINQINFMIAKLYNDLNLKSMSLEDKIKTYHDYLIKSTTYDKAFVDTKSSIYSSNKATGALIEHYAVCGGYTDAMATFLDYLKVPNILIINNNHTWNLVNINDEWLHIDATWNDTEIERYDYEFYLIDNKKLYELDTKEHTFDKLFYIEAK